MRENWNTMIEGVKVILVPYKREHVEKYHGWMKSKELQELTGSEPLSLEEEYKMQETWRDSGDKCTFIVLDKDLLESFAFNESDEIASMVGDTNLFISTSGGDGDGGEKETKMAEAEIMIAEEGARGKGLGKEAMALMMNYGARKLGVGAFEARIKVHNERSIKMFEKMGFAEVGRSEVFGEVTLKATADDLVALFDSATESSVERTYGQDDDDYRPPKRANAVKNAPAAL